MADTREGLLARKFYKNCSPTSASLDIPSICREVPHTRFRHLVLREWEIMLHIFSGLAKGFFMKNWQHFVEVCLVGILLISFAWAGSITLQPSHFHCLSSRSRCTPEFLVRRVFVSAAQMRSL